MQEVFDDVSGAGISTVFHPKKINHWSWNATNDKKNVLPETPTQDYYADYLFQSQNPRG